MVSTEDRLNQLFGESDEVLYLSNQHIILEQGETQSLEVYINNLGSSDNVGFAFDVEVVDAPGDIELKELSNWFIWNKEVKEFIQRPMVVILVHVSSFL